VVVRSLVVMVTVIIILSTRSEDIMAIISPMMLSLGGRAMFLKEASTHISEVCGARVNILFVRRMFRL